MSDPYSQYWKRWQQRALRSVRLDIGYVPGLLLHYWHGAKRDRKYVDRWQILTRNKFDPSEDLILSLIHISEPTRPCGTSRMPSSA